MKKVMALIEGQITVHEALLYQCEAKKGLHTAKSGLFLRVKNCKGYCQGETALEVFILKTYYLLTINNNTENSLKLFVDLKHLVSKPY